MSEEEGVRYLHFGSHWVQGAMRIARPWSLELEYTRDMMMALLMRPAKRWPKTVLLIGLGAASLTKFLYRNLPRSTLTVVEIDLAVVRTATQFFKLPVDPRRIAIEIGDGHDFVATTTDREFDLILVDGFDAKSRIGKLSTLEFYRNCRARLTAQGVLAANFLNARRGLAQSLERMSEGFGGRAFALPHCASGNVIALAASGMPIALSLDEMRASARRVKRDTGLNLLPTLARLEQTQVAGSDQFTL
ncbi:MAG TPA: fused MFS/spermidine synthase [Casimicrobiaceae bacterium]|nr:fused MFS/spermidine synthase [Casimicrobiaceae bacterium]